MFKVEGDGKVVMRNMKKKTSIGVRRQGFAIRERSSMKALVKYLDLMNWEEKNEKNEKNLYLCCA